MPKDLALRARNWIVRYRVVLYLLAGLLVVELLVASQEHLWRRYDPDEYRERVAGCRRSPRDLIVVGGSPVVEGIDPAILAGMPWHGQPLRRVYNLGLPGGTTTEVWHAVEHGITTPPRLLIYGITATDVNESRNEPSGPRTLVTVKDLRVWWKLRPASVTWAVRHFARGHAARLSKLFVHRNAIRLWAADCLESLWPGSCPQAAAEAREGLHFAASLRAENGYAPRPNMQASRLDLLKASGQLDTRFSFLEKFYLGGHLAYLGRLLDWARERKVAVVLVDMPVSADLEERLFPAAFATYRAAVTELARARRVRFLSSARAGAGLEDADFADLIHMNKRGAARFSAWLRQALAEQ
jgi:hypothetical protein